jgi:Hemerythrin HHE cation binding domain
MLISSHRDRVSDGFSTDGVLGRWKTSVDDRRSRMDPTKLLEADHRQVEELFDRIQKADGSGRPPLIGELRTALEAHMQLEEEVVYPAMKPVTGQEEVEEAQTEHELARSALAEMLNLAPDEPGFGAALETTKAAIDHHVQDEEGEVFPTLRRDGEGVLADMATPFMRRRLELGLPMRPDALAAASNKDELLEEARLAGVEGAASMTKDELAKALSARMTS